MITIKSLQKTAYLIYYIKSNERKQIKRTKMKVNEDESENYL